jgi:predicted nucleic acid-binding protein
VIVVDTSAVVDLLLESPINAGLIARLDSVTELHVPHLVDVEFLSVLRRLVGRSLMSADQADIARTKFSQLPLHRYPHHPLAERVWDLRSLVTVYDGQFIVLAEMLRLPLITCDARLAAAHGHTATVESFTR